METMCRPGYHHNGFVATYALRHMIYSFTVLIPMNHTVLNKLRKEHNISDHKSRKTQKELKSHRSKTGVIYM